MSNSLSRNRPAGRQASDRSLSTRFTLDGGRRGGYLSLELTRTSAELNCLSDRVPTFTVKCSRSLAERPREPLFLRYTEEDNALGDLFIIAGKSLVAFPAMPMRHLLSASHFVRTYAIKPMPHRFWFRGPAKPQPCSPSLASSAPKERCDHGRADSGNQPRRTLPGIVRLRAA